jgi:hypothetical protein
MKDTELRMLRQQLLAAMDGSHAHIAFDAALDDLPEEARGKKVRGAPHTAWQLLEHIRIAQWDILEFSRDAKHESPKWPEGYWPKEGAPPNENAWEESLSAFRRDYAAMRELVESGDLFSKIPHGGGQTLLREAVVIANHNSYHLGQLMFLRRMLE